MPILTLLSDFGLKDPYVAEMKAVILSICPKVQIVDISHRIEKFNIRNGAFVLASASPYFPEGSIHVAIVDPGVGTKRRPLIIETGRCFYVGPDNGLLPLSAQREGIRHIYLIQNPQYILPKVSRTFHGRDIFAPAAAHLARGCMASEFGPEIHDYVLPSFVKAHIRAGVLFGEVLHIDAFGNVISNISAEDLGKNIGDASSLSVTLGGRTLSLKLCSAYGQVPVRKPLAIIGSGNFLEISINQGSAAQVFRANTGDPVQVLPIQSPH